MPERMIGQSKWVRECKSCCGEMCDNHAQKMREKRQWKKEATEAIWERTADFDDEEVVDYAKLAYDSNIPEASQWDFDNATERPFKPVDKDDTEW